MSEEHIARHGAPPRAPLWLTLLSGAAVAGLAGWGAASYSAGQIASEVTRHSKQLDQLEGERTTIAAGIARIDQRVEDLAAYWNVPRRGSRP